MEKNIWNHEKLGRTKELGGKTGESVRLDLPSASGGTEAGVQSPYHSNCLSQKKHLRLRVKQMICGSLNGMRIRQFLLQPYIPQTGTQVPWKVQQVGAGV